MKEEINILPETADTGSILKAGLHLVKIQSIENAINEEGSPKTDRNGNPGLKITFENKEGDTISQVYYYSILPINHPDRLDDNKRCKSEFKLTQLKKAFGFGHKPISLAEIKTRKCWIAIRRQDFVDTQGSPIIKDGKQKSFHQIADVWPLKDPLTDPSRGRPVLKGDPEIDSGNFFIGYFYELKVDVVPIRTVISNDEFGSVNETHRQQVELGNTDELKTNKEQIPVEDW